MNLSSACRILIASHSIDHARDVAHRIKAVASEAAADAVHGASETDDTDDPSSATQDVDINTNTDENTIAWRISNKYYTADVHFKAIELEQWNLWELEGVPAVIFAWSPEHPYKEHAKNVARDLEDREVEVALAIRASEPVKTSGSSDEDHYIEEFFSVLGLELVNSDANVDSVSGRDGISKPQSGTLGLRRAVDALSTIMWPSMVQSDLTRHRKNKSRNLMNLMGAEDEPDDMRSLIGEGPSQYEDDDDYDESVHKERMRREMEELERWLDGDDDPPVSQPRKQDNLAAGLTPSLDVVTPTISYSPTATSEKVDTDYKFDDDFTDFVSASTNEPEDPDASYSSLHSDSENDPVDVNDDDPEMPTQSEVKEASQRIFGAPPVFFGPPRPPPAASTSHTTTNAGGPDDDSAEEPPFDLSTIVGALQSMKDEIAGIKDEKERRRAAAKVALGLAYGLRLDGVENMDLSEE